MACAVMLRRSRNPNSSPPNPGSPQASAADATAIRVSARSARTTRALGRAPRVVGAVVVAVLCVGGIRAAVAPRVAEAPALRLPRAPGPDYPAEAFAQAFARSYLTWSPGSADGYDAAVARFASSELEPGAGLRPPPGGTQSVRWTAVAGDSPRGATRVVTVLVGTTGGDLTLAVPVQRDSRGLLSIAAYPALVGPPPANPQPPQSDEPTVADGDLMTVAKRVVTNYLARSPQNLAADLAQDAVVVTPAQPFRATRFDTVTWARPGRTVAVVVEAQRRDGLQMTLRYELAVVRRAGRWLVRVIEINPIDPEVVP